MDVNDYVIKNHDKNEILNPGWSKRTLVYVDRIKKVIDEYPNFSIILNAVRHVESYIIGSTSKFNYLSFFTFQQSRHPIQRMRHRNFITDILVVFNDRRTWWCQSITSSIVFSKHSISVCSCLFNNNVVLQFLVRK
jgi:hypothetical protein